MAIPRKIILFAACLAACLLLVEIYAQHAVRTNPAGQALARYLPEGPDHAVFLGSSLTDAAVRSGDLDSILGARIPGFRAFNLALAGLSGSDNYYILYKGFILPRSHPRYLVVEAAGIPFLPPVHPFALEGGGLRVESFRSEFIDYADFLHLRGGFPGVAPSLSFWLHRHWFSYHNRMEIQARIRERLFPAETGSAGNPYRMAQDATGMFGNTAREELVRLESLPDADKAMRLPSARLLDLARITKENGTALVVLRPPMPPSDSLTGRSEAFRSYTQAFAALCESLGVVYLDLSGEPSCGPYSFSDGIHLDKAGARVFTGCLAEALGKRMGTDGITARP